MEVACGMSPVLTIDPEFQSLIPPLSAQEFELLRQQIRERGCLEPLYVWKDGDNRILLDGHNRYKICGDGLPYTYIKVPNIGSREEAKLWILEHQAGRRNLTDDQRAAIWNEIREARSKLAVAAKMQKARDAKAGGLMSAKTADIALPKRDTRKEIAAESRLPEGKLRQAQALKKADPNLYEEVRTGKRTLPQARKQLRSRGQSGKPRRDRDYFQRLGRRLDGVFKGEFKQRLDELSRLKAVEITPVEEEGIREIVAILQEVAKRAAAYATKLSAVSQSKRKAA
jgi:hypothetical protein